MITRFLSLLRRPLITTNEFSLNPSGRLRIDGPDSGQRFREEILLPALSDNKKAFVILNSRLGYSYGFLEEAFGGLVRAGFSASYLRNNLKIDADLQICADRAWRYIEEAAERNVEPSRATDSTFTKIAEWITFTAFLLFVLYFTGLTEGLL